MLLDEGALEVEQVRDPHSMSRGPRTEFGYTRPMTPDQRKLIDLEFDQCVEQRQVLFLGGGWPGEGLKREHSLTAGGRWGQRADMSSCAPSSLRETSS